MRTAPDVRGTLPECRLNPYQLLCRCTGQANLNPESIALQLLKLVKERRVVQNCQRESQVARSGTALRVELRSLEDDVSPAMEQLVDRLLAKRRENRPQTPREVVAALEQLEGERAQAAAKPAAPTRRRRRR